MQTSISIINNMDEEFQIFSRYLFYGYYLYNISEIQCFSIVVPG